MATNTLYKVLVKPKEIEYKEYIQNHQLNVARAWAKIKENRDCMNVFLKYINTTEDALIESVNEMVRNHDASKFSKEEFDPYRKNFYPMSPDEKESNLKAFDKAWEHHYTNNLHHWDWWYKTGQADAMPLLYVIEMICDWLAMSFHFGNSAKEWYENEKKKNTIHLGVIQQQFVEEILNILYS